MSTLSPTQPDGVRSNRSDDLSDALNRGEFRFFFQPQFQLETRDLVGFEALIRWVRPHATPVLPSAFLPDMKRKGLLHQAGRSLFVEALELMAELGSKRHLRVAVNLAESEWQPGIFDWISSQLDLHRLSGRQLELELTEDIPHLTSPAMLKEARQLRAAGVHLSLDDFGTGFGCLGHLEVLPIDGLKLDRRFVSAAPVSPRARAIVQSVLTLGRHLSVNVTAEGIETLPQLRFLLEAGCPRAQGFLLGQPTLNPKRFLSGPDCWW